MILSLVLLIMFISMSPCKTVGVHDAHDAISLSSVVPCRRQSHHSIRLQCQCYDVDAAKRRKQKGYLCVCVCVVML
ncbi:hypothetical protein B0T21DRAFT_366830 [Apiosordaria backusii]|uniref:Secreted protein n=1 Tax=Apiosordaria backusii TaxID=314023 RepID=A0AA40BLL5_9PEZI|nr:hypothetical protein B0T21DRAFT_366830 [Apiosordaria backusii]